MASLSPAAHPPPVSRPYRRRIWIAFTIGFIVGASIGFYFVSTNWPYRYRKIRPMLEDDLASQINVTSYHRTYWPNPGFVATGLTLRRKTALNLPPFGHAEMMTVQGRWRDLLLLRHRVQTVEVTGLHIVIPPIGSQANHANFPPGSSSDFTGPDTAIEMFKIHNSILEIMKNDGKRLIFPVRELDLANFEKNKAIHYSVDMQNAIPSGRIESRGTFGPLNAKEIGRTPVNGTFTFSGVHLHDVGDIAGTLSAQGKFHGPLVGMEAQADSITPDFSVDEGRATRVEGSIQCTVNGTDGDVAMHHVELHTGATTISAAGSVQGSPKVTNVDIDVRGGRAEDVMRPFIHDQVPITGSVWLHSHAYLEPDGHGAPFLHRLHVSGTFAVPAERITDQDTEKSLTEFSHRAQDKKDAELDDKPADADALSSLKGPVQIQDGVASSKHVAFRIPGAQADLGGTFNFHDKTVHMVGDLRMDTDISHTATGFKSLLLKPLAPFFKKKNAGAVVPIAVTGAPGHYQVTQDLAHKK
jgi:AsmA-like C-terminal region